ncbi:MAG: hypothetical protein ABFD86_14990 [Bryobacteraceae bacterium]
MKRLCLLLLISSAALAQEGVLTFDKISKYDRAAEPASFGIPFSQGVLRDAALLEVSDGSNAVPSQTRVTSRWPDGSVRWAYVRTLVDLPGNRGKQITWKVAGRARTRTSALKAELSADGSLLVSTGPVSARIPSQGFFPLTDVKLNGVAFPGRMAGFAFHAGAHTWSTADAGPVKIVVVEQGPVALVVQVSGRHGPEQSPFDFTANLTFWAGKPYVGVDYRVLAARGDKEQLIDSWTWAARTAESAPRVREGHGHYGVAVRESGQKAAYSFGLREFRFDAVEHSMQSYWGDFWGDWVGASSALAVTLRQAQQNFPKAMEVTNNAVTVSLYPSSGEALRFPLGAAKSHQILLHFHEPSLPVKEISARSLQFQIPDIPKLAAAWYARAGVWDDPVFGAPSSRRVGALLYDVLDNRPVGAGTWNFGDEVDWGYTGQGRGRDDVVWLNNEYDLTHQMFLHYARTGERRFLDYAFSSARHWRDVDIAHVSSDPLLRGGHIAHSPRHVTGGVSPSHQWVEGLFDAWHMFGDESAREAALGIGENILRHMALARYREAAHSSTRDMGWALRAMLALHRETGDARYAEAARPIVDLFKRWHAEYPGLLSPYTDHSQVRVVFMNSLTLVSLARYHRRFPDEELKRVILEETDDLIRNTRNANGLFFYKELPSLEFQGATLLVLQLLGEAYRLSGDTKYLEAGLPEIEYFLANMNGRFEIHTGASEKFAHSGGGYTRTLFYPPGGKFIGISLTPLVEFLEAAKATRLAENLDWQLRLK